LLFVAVSPVCQTLLATHPRRTDAEYMKAITDGAETEMRILVVGDDGKPIGGALVMAAFAMREKFVDAIATSRRHSIGERPIWNNNLLPPAAGFGYNLRVFINHQKEKM